MTIRRVAAMVTLISFVMVFPARDVCAATTDGQGPGHSVSRTALHQSVQSSHVRVTEARALVNQFMARPDVQKQLRRAGIAPARMAATVAALSDEEIVRLQQHVMTADLQGAPAGLSTGAILAIVFAGIGGSILLLWLLIEAEEDLYDDYYD
jgi:glucose-6-phosphate isomerase